MKPITQFVTLHVNDKWQAVCPQLVLLLAKQPGVRVQYTGVQEGDSGVAYWFILWESIDHYKVWWCCTSSSAVNSNSHHVLQVFVASSDHGTMKTQLDLVNKGKPVTKLVDFERMPYDTSMLSPVTEICTFVRDARFLISASPSSYPHRLSRRERRGLHWMSGLQSGQPSCPRCLRMV